MEQVVSARIRGFLCTNAHPAGCAENVRQQIDLCRQAGPGKGLGTALVLGSSTGYGLASLAAAVFGYGADAVSVCFERPAAGGKTASAGWYNLVELHRAAKAAGRHVVSINGDAFSNEIKSDVIARLRDGFRPIDLLVYSLASPRRKDPDSETVWTSALKPIGAPYTGKSIELKDGNVVEVTMDTATADEIESTVKVMGGDDWSRWVETLLAAGLLAPGFRTVAYSYIGPKVTQPIYRSGTIGRAKEHLETTAKALDRRLAAIHGRAYVSVNKAIVTQASAAIPAVPLYISILYRVMKETGTHEGAAEQIVRMMRDHLAPGMEPKLDDAGRIRMDDWEMKPEIQDEVGRRWDRANSENLRQLADWDGFQLEFRRLFGFDVDGVDYQRPVEVEVDID